MITHEQAQEYLAAHPFKRPTREVLATFSTPYRLLAQAVMTPINGTDRQPMDPYREAFHESASRGFNPWESEEGRRLATTVFGQARGPYISATWELLDRLPYQISYQRLPYRTRATEQYVAGKLRVLQYLYHDGLGALTLIDYLRYIPYHNAYYTTLSPLLAAALSGPERAELLAVATDIINGEDEVGRISKTMLKALLLSDHPSDWELVGGLLLAARQQEGLRQSILEVVDETSLGALRYLIGVILKHDLVRFSSVVRAVDVWFGFNWEAAKQSTITRILELAKELFDVPEARQRMLVSEDNLERHLALWYTALTDVDAANQLAKNMLGEPERDKRLLALLFITSTLRSVPGLIDWMEAHFGEDPEIDLRLLYVPRSDAALSDELFDRVLARGQSLSGGDKTFTGSVFAWRQSVVTADAFYRYLVDCGSEQQLARLGEDLASIPNLVREQYMRRLFPHHYSYSYSRKPTEVPPVDLDDAPWKRGVILQALRDRNQSVMLTGLLLLQAIELREEDLPDLVNLLARKGKELRGGLIDAILRARPGRIAQLVPQLLESGKVEQRLAGLEILSELQEREEFAGLIAGQVESYRERGQFSKNEQLFLDRFTTRAEQPSFANGFGVVDAANLRAAYLPGIKIVPAAKKGLLSRLLGKEEAPGYLLAHLVDRDKIVSQVGKLVGLLQQHADHEYTTSYLQPSGRVTLVGREIRPRHGMPTKTYRQYIESLPLSGVWVEWYRQSGLSDFELYALLTGRVRDGDRGYPKEYNAFFDHYELRLPVAVYGQYDSYGRPQLPVRELIRDIYDAYADHGMLAQFATDLFEDQVARLPQELRTTLKWERYPGYFVDTHWTEVMMQRRPYSTGGGRAMLEAAPSPDVLLQLYGVQRQLFASRQLGTYPVTSVADLTRTPRIGHTATVDHHLVLQLGVGGHLSDDELRLHALHDQRVLEGLEHYLLLTGPEQEAKRSLALRAFSPLKQALLDVELERGELATEATTLVRGLKIVEGSDRLIHTLARMGKENFHRGYSYNSSNSRRESFSAIVKKSVPGPQDAVNTFVEQARTAKIIKKRWLEVAMYAPQWAPWVAELLDVPELESAIWWFHAHASGYMSKEKETIVARYSAIERADLANGAIDIDWFYAVYRAVGKGNWKLLHDASRYISDGNGHRQVKLYSAILLGEVKLSETVAKIEEKRDQVYVKGLGLVPLSKQNPAQDTLNRYELLQRFLAESKQYGNQRQESERQAVEIALDNLARTAGYDDTVRFGWVMEGESTRRLLADNVVEIGDLKVELYIDQLGKAQIGVERKGKPLKSVPAKQRKQQDVQRLQDARQTLRKQLSRTRQSLEQAMNAGTLFAASELADIYRHPIVHVMLDQLVLITEDGQASGFFRGDHLSGPTGKAISVEADTRLRIAHPYDLYQEVSWDQYQKLAFDRKLQQPFKQIFRELYLITDDERETGRHSTRYQGHQIQPKKAIALLRGRGWTVSNEEGLQRVDHRRGIIATMYAAADWFTPGDVEAPTIEQVAFYDRRTYKYLPIAEVDPLLFSEVMRDIDLVVSVAHVGDVDPEASHSTLEMRAALARESARLFKLDNVTVTERFIIIENSLGKFNIHLGSGIVSKQRLQLDIQAVQSQHRGRIFLPFVDDDPKSAEIITKMRLIAREKEIKDPTIIHQLTK